MMLLKHSSMLLAWIFVFGCLGWPQTDDLVPVISRQLSRTAELPGEFQPYLSVSLRAKVPGYVERILVDRAAPSKRGNFSSS